MNGEGYLLDTNILIGLLKGHRPAVERLEEVDKGVLAYSSITRMELLGFPGLTADELRAIDELLEGLEYLPLTRSVENRVIALRQRRRIKLPDAIIAATALEWRYALLTLDETLAKVFSEANTIS